MLINFNLLEKIFMSSQNQKSSVQAVAANNNVNLVYTELVPDQTVRVKRSVFKKTPKLPEAAENFSFTDDSGNKYNIVYLRAKSAKNTYIPDKDVLVVFDPVYRLVGAITGTRDSGSFYEKPPQDSYGILYFKPEKIVDMSGTAYRNSKTPDKIGLVVSSTAKIHGIRADGSEGMNNLLNAINAKNNEELTRQNKIQITNIKIPDSAINKKLCQDCHDTIETISPKIIPYNPASNNKVHSDKSM